MAIKRADRSNCSLPEMRVHGSKYCRTQYCTVSVFYMHGEDIYALHVVSQRDGAW